MKIGYVILTYNQEKLLDWQLNALKKQTKKPHQIIVIDNNSDKPYRKRKDIIYKRMEYDGLDRRSLARNTGAGMCNTDVIIFLDGDIIPGYDLTEYVHLFFVDPANKKNIFLPNRIEVYNKAELNRRLIKLYSPLKNIMERRKLILMQEYGITFPSAAFGIRKDIFVKTGGFNIQFSGWGFEDTDLAYRMRKNKSKFMINPYVFVHHKAHQRPEFNPEFKNRLVHNAETLWKLHPNEMTDSYLNLHLVEWGFSRDEIKEITGVKNEILQKSI